MKYIGAVVVLVSGYVLGRCRRGNQLGAERILRQARQLLRELERAVAHNAGSLIALLGDCAARESYNKLGFLAQAMENQREQNNALAPALCGALDDWEDAARLSRDEQQILHTLFSSMGSGSARAESERLCFAIEQLDAALQTRSEINRNRKGYYETLYTLAGAAIAILLL